MSFLYRQCKKTSAEHPLQLTQKDLLLSFFAETTAKRALQRALQTLGHDVSRTPNEWMALDTGDKRQLLEASARGRCLLTHNISDFMRLAQTCPDHGGIVLAHQQAGRPLVKNGLIAALNKMLAETDASDWPG